MSRIKTYQPQNVAFVRGEGVRLWDTDDKVYLDGLSGIAVNGLGHSHPHLVEALQTQTEALWHTSNVYRITKQEELAERLCQLTGMDQAFFSNSGAEANEAAIKIARLYGHQRGFEKPAIIVMESAFHGRTMATLTASGSRKIQAGFEPLVPGFLRAPYNDLEAIEQIAENADQIVAVFVEPVQGEGGINTPADDYLPKLRELCDKHEWLLMLDEVQTGNARTGHLFAFQAHNIIPDVLVTAKGLGNGFPIGATLMSNRANDLITPGKHGSTFGGNPLACTVANAVLDIISDKTFLKEVQNKSAYFAELIESEIIPLEGVETVRQAGFMIGIELDRPCKEMVKLSLDEGILVNVTAEKVIRLLPPLIMEKEDIKTFVTTLRQCIVKFLEM